MTTTTSTRLWLITGALLSVAAAAPVSAQPGLQTEADRIQAETRRVEQEREQRFQQQQAERRIEADRQDQRRQQELRLQERTPPSSRPTPLIPQNPKN
ncbi:hypothetical protein FNB15_10495 [Ferrovibrio terrae]|uniref:Uncharacterized protein n=1 Tax=Ferrovibrio terrae TaxID=2594003 RepID=A0A516H1M5_9PROT|nr:hypothetical protein [Ferrovibrio terrae]QDO97672.1 hypothetical protein FNB15_10495 [Ferrovibrio terrae]